MIGGVDIVIPSVHSPAQTMERVVKVFQRAWPKAVFQDANTSDLLSGCLTASEILVYQDAKVLEEWDAREEDTNKMAYLLTLTVGYMTIVIDDPDLPEIRGILELCLQVLRGA